MNNCRIPGGLLSLLVAVTAVSVRPSQAMCVEGELPRVATVTVEGCTELTDFADQRLEGHRVRWLVRYVDGVVASYDGVVIAGTITKKVHVRQYGDTDFVVEDVEEVEQPGEWFVQTELPVSCDDDRFQGETELYVTDPCCDVIPPYDVPCTLDVGSAGLVVPALEELLEREVR